MQKKALGRGLEVLIPVARPLTAVAYEEREQIGGKAGGDFDRRVKHQIDHHRQAPAVDPVSGSDDGFGHNVSCHKGC